ncbi:MAG: PAS domain-containing protein [Acidobacteriota bacterium]|nr:PAS domain-containing protein [Acidobacteriota bacterium]
MEQTPPQPGRRLHQYWSDLPLRRKGLVVVVIPLLPLLVTAATLYHSDVQLARSQAAATRAIEVSDRLGALLTGLVEAEAGARGYLLTGREESLEQYRRAQSRLPGTLARLDDLIARNPGSPGVSPEQVAGLDGSVRAFVEALGALVPPARPGGPVDAARSVPRLDRSAAQLDGLRQAIARLSARSADVRRAREAQAAAALHRTFLLTAIGLAFGLCGGVVAMLLFMTGIANRLRRKARAAECLARGEPLPVLVPARDEIGQLGRRIREADALLQARDRSRQRALEDLQASESRLHAILDYSPTVIYLKDLDGRFVLVNRTFERLFGRTRDEIQGLTDADLHPPDAAARIRRDDLAVLEGHRAIVLEERGWIGGRERVYMSIKFPIDDHAGVARAVCGISIEITERKQAEESIQQLNAALRQRMAELTAVNQELEAFSYSVSHDLRAPLRHVAGFAALLERTSADRLDDQGRRYLKTIGHAAGRMGELIDDLLVFSRMGRVELRRTAVAVGELVEEVVTEVIGDGTGRAIDWVIKPLPVVQADRAMLRQALLNLVSNAVKYTGTRPRAVIELGACAEAPGMTAVYVRDNGVGFDMQYADKLFGVFQRLHAADQFEGTGIGLANVRRIVQRHGGRTWADGVVDGGATFWMTLPLAGEADA